MIPHEIEVARRFTELAQVQNPGHGFVDVEAYRHYLTAALAISTESVSTWRYP